MGQKIYTSTQYIYIYRSFLFNKLCRWADITDSGLDILAKLPLTRLSLNACFKLTDAGLGKLRRLRLVGLDLGYMGLTNASLQHLRSMPLASLGLSGSDWLTDAGLGEILGELRNLPGQNSPDPNFPGQTSPGGNSQGQNSPGSSSPGQDTAGQGSAAAKFTSLDLSFCGRLSPAALEHLMGLPISELDLSGAWWLTDSGLERLYGLPLVSLILRGCPQMGHDALRFFNIMYELHTVHGLARVNIEDCDALAGINYRMLMLEYARPWFSGFERSIVDLQF